MRIGFIGLGKLGLPCALAINSKEHQVWGYDINPEVENILISRKVPYTEKFADTLLANHTIKFGSIAEVVENSDIIFVPIQTPHDPKFEGCTSLPEDRANFDYTALKSGIEALSNEIKNQSENKTVIIISTVLPGTIEKEINPIIKDNEHFNLCYNPFFIAMGTTITDFLCPEFVLFGTENESVAQKVKEFYSTIHDKPFYQTTIKNSELIKVAYNTFIGMKIVFANTIMEICHKTGANIDGVMGALKMANSRLISPKYLNGGMGDGGGCHPRDNIAMSWLAKELNLSYNFFDDLMTGREKQTDFLIELLLENSGPYYIFGKTFKEETNLVLGSAAILLANILNEKGVEFTHWDPHVDIDTPNMKKGTYIVATKHDTFKDIEFPSGSTVIDVWRYLSFDDKTIKHIKVGINE